MDHVICNHEVAGSTPAAGTIPLDTEDLYLLAL